MFYQIFLSQKVKKCEIINYKEDIFELSHELPNNIRPTILGNYYIPGKCANFKE